LNDHHATQGVGARVGAKRPVEDPPAGGGPAAATGPNRPDDVGEPISAAALAARVHAEHLTLQAELSEIELLVGQARTEAARHEAKRAAAADRLAVVSQTRNAADIADLSKQLVTLTRRAVVMQTQVDVLEGKLKVLQRFRDASGRIAADLDTVVAGGGAAIAPGVRAGRGGRATAGESAAGGTTDAAAGADAVPTAVSRIVLAAQEDLRREIARTMHDGPAQSLTNIVLQAQIVERLLIRDPASAAAEVRQLISMVQQTLDATKSFIFDVRPMVLDDLGLVPTIRRAARDRGRRAQIPVVFESYGADRRLTMELESGLFRIIDEALGAYLAGRPDRLTIRLDWSDGLEVRIEAHRTAAAPFDAGTPSAAAVAADAAQAETTKGRGRGRTQAATTAPEAMPAALAAMIEDRRAADTAAKRAVGAIPAATRRDIAQRAATLGVTLELADDGREVRIVVEGPAGTE
jgi:signal transduction histidine kinase